jgi:hypothetical protein
MEWDFCGVDQWGWMMDGRAEWPGRWVLGGGFAFWSMIDREIRVNG